MAAPLNFLLAIGLLFAAATAIVDDDYFTEKVFHGDGTYYGATEAGNCAIRRPRPAFYRNYVPVAINTDQYKGMCGACIEVTGDGEGEGANPIVGTFKAYVMDRCPECEYGDIDLSKSGDGRWKVSWKVIPCQGDSRISFQFEGSNQHYLKLQPRGMKSPAKKVKVNDIECEPTQDNHWIAKSESGFKGKFKVVVYTVLGEEIESWLSSYHGVVYGGRIGDGEKQDPDTRKQRPNAWKPKPRRRKPNVWKPKPRRQKRNVWKPKPRRQKRNVWKPKPRPWTPPQKRWRRRAHCVPKWHPCSGPKNAYGTSKCCNGFKCKWPARKSFGAKRCEPVRKPARCVPRWQPCTGRNNVYGTSKCCGGWSCAKPTQKNFVGRRCEPLNPRFVGCRRAWDRCGTYKKWTRWNGRPMQGRHCCPRGHVCKWASDNFGFRCEPWQESFRKWWK